MAITVNIELSKANDLRLVEIEHELGLQVDQVFEMGLLISEALIKGKAMNIGIGFYLTEETGLEVIELGSSFFEKARQLRTEGKPARFEFTLSNQSDDGTISETPEERV